MQEQLLHRIWQRKRFDHNDLRTSAGQKLKIIHYGNYNTHAGPDFQNGHIQLDKQNWFGHIELHIKSSDWKKHNHSTDPAYNNVILHVVFEDDADVLTQSGIKMPTLILKDRIDKAVLKRYEALNQSMDSIPCHAHLNSIDIGKAELYLHRLLTERLQRKSNELSNALKTSKGDWETILFKWLLKYACPKSNKEAFELLGERTPLKLVQNYSNNVFKLEALILGQAGLLNGYATYFRRLKREYQLLRIKHHLLPMHGVEWRFSRMRPAQFPYLRIVQLVQLYSKYPRLFQTIVNTPVNQWKGLFNVTTSEYWKSHYLPGRPSTPKIKRWGKVMINNILINVIIPLIYIYGKQSGRDNLSENAIELIYTLPFENNNIVRLWQEAGIKAKNAGQSQALIQLKSEYCNHYLCMNCSIGQELLFK